MGAASKSPASWLAGFIPDLPTPFDETGAIDLKAFARLCERQIAAGVPAIVVSETAGEASTLTPTEQETVIRTAVEVAGGHVRVIAGAGSNSTSQAIDLSTFFPAGSNWDLDSLFATSVNNRGEIIGTGSFKDGTVHNFVLIPVHGH